MVTMMACSEYSLPWTAFRKACLISAVTAEVDLFQTASSLCLLFLTQDLIKVVVLLNQILLISAYGKLQDGKEITIMAKERQTNTWEQQYTGLC
jgi:hypothetical protein